MAILAGVAFVLFLIFSIGLYINLWFGIFFIIWTILSIAYLIANLSNKSGTSSWYEWIFAGPALMVAVIFAFFDRLINKNEKN